MKRFAFIGLMMFIVLSSSCQCWAKGHAYSDWLSILLIQPENSFSEVKEESISYLSQNLSLVAIGISFLAGAAFMGFIWEIIQEWEKHHHPHQN
ncbi:hypothetical protein [Solitalea lacus]|uniref:hypothetical protein n=1 Tax=Solitalea lacus TaxID=2911172 RepID=UPI001EDA1FFD|nr:hypothetical protein [Solitalea lacus]UKJ07760.1 hypothetical protein L2B55_01015 [Solitalea lacus]